MNSTSTSFLNYQNQSDFGFRYVQSLNGDQLTHMQVHISNETNQIELKQVFNLKTLKSRKYSLKKPVPLLISKEGDEFKAEVKPLEIVAFGESLSEVVSEISEEIADLCDVVLSHELHELGQSPRAWRNVLAGIVSAKA